MWRGGAGALVLFMPKNRHNDLKGGARQGAWRELKKSVARPALVL